MDLYNRGGFTEGYYHQHNGPKMMLNGAPESFRDRGGPADFTEKRRYTGDRHWNICIREMCWDRVMILLSV